MSMSQPYSKSQFSEKLRRLRKKFRVISSRLDKGLDYSQLSLQDQALFDLSKQLWDPFSLPSASTAVLALPSAVTKPGGKMNKVGGGFKRVDEVKLVEKEVKVKKDDLRSGIVRFVTAAAADVVDRSLKEMMMVIDVGRVKSLEREMSFERRWRDQRAAEFDVLAKRLKLIVERSSVAGK
ncbi:uncharacterized protein LOC143569439 [Bidens hawaiensis]|uniref:uncharacterized protein LOC143569439 n=1 Tax=Bidens hawaiensis TaxID=980011 RepID=UPI0040499E33